MWLLPDDYLVLRVAMRANKLVDILGVGQVADLAASVDPVKRLARQRVPEPYTSVGGASTAAHHAVLVRRPRDGLDGCLVLTEFGQRLARVLAIPNQQLVVVAA